MADSDAKVFTNKDGQKIDAEIQSKSADKVVLKLLKNDKVYTISIATLVEGDQKFINEWKSEEEEKERDKEDIKPEAGTSDDGGASYEYGHFFYSNIKKKYELEDNFDAEWPKMTSTDIPEIEIVKEDDETKVYVYQSENYEFVCDVRLSKNVVKKFSHLFEATRDYCKAIPISMMKAHLPDGKYKYKILLFENEKTYFKNGGPSGSAGVYMSGKDVIMVPLTSLGVKKVGSGYMFDYDGSNKTLPHEITHQLTNLEYYNAGARGWFSEGLAEYIAMTDYRSGKYMIRSNLKDIRDAVTGFAKKSGRGRNIGTEIKAPDLKQFMNMTYGEFTANGNFNYGLGTLVTYYFLHMDGDEKRKNVNAFLMALNEGKKGDEVIKLLLNGRSYDELEVDIYKAWKSKGVEINFK